MRDVSATTMETGDEAAGDVAGETADEAAGDMRKDAPARRVIAIKKRTLSQRLLQALTGEVRALERALRSAQAAGEETLPEAAAAAGAKARVDAIGNLTRTLEKLLDLARLEGIAAKGGLEEEGEAERLRAELIRRLKAIDARRGGGRRLFGAGAAAALA